MASANFTCNNPHYLQQMQALLTNLLGWLIGNEVRYNPIDRELVMKLYVGNLPYTVRDEELNAAFAAYGEVISAVVIMDRETGRSKGFGFVEMSDAEGKAAMEALNEQDMGGRAIRVSEARPKAPRPRTA
jgi:RNA recognition motif-containing protein